MSEGGRAPVQEGEILAGRYRVERVLAEGGMGVVVAARHTQLGQRVALKFLLSSVPPTSEAAIRFRREGQAAALLRSEHVTRVIDVGQLESGAPYMVMEFLEGCDLGELVERDGPLSVETAVEYILQACEGLAEAHSAKIVHRDLKPSNLFRTVRPDGSALIKILDFGISKMDDAGTVASGGAMTSTSAVMGSPLYMSPEQMQSSKNVDPRTDIWALGVVLQQLLTGRPSFEAEMLAGLCVAIATMPPTPLGATLPDAPPELAAIIQKCLEKKPDARFQNVAELAVALGPLAPNARTHVERTWRQIMGTTQPPLSPDGRTIRIETNSQNQTDPLAHTKTALAGSTPDLALTPRPKAPTGLILGGAAAVLAVVAVIAGVAISTNHPAATATATQPSTTAAPTTPATVAATAAPTTPSTVVDVPVGALPVATSTTPRAAPMRAGAGTRPVALTSASAAPKPTASATASAVPPLPTGAMTGFSNDRK